MSKKLLSTLIASLFVASPALAQSEDPLRVGGSATIGGIYNDVDAKDKAKLQEYQDLSNGALSNVFVQGRNSLYWFQGYGENFGRSDQYMFLRGGMFDGFKAGAYLNDMPHLFATNALTPYTGVGSGLLQTTFPQFNPDNWNSFTLGYDRRDAGGYFEWQKNSPWYFRADGNQVRFEGTKVGAAANGTSPGNGYVALPFPNNSTTSNWGVEGGYQSPTLTVSARWDYSKYDNSIETLNWTNPYSFGAPGGANVYGNRLDTSYLAPDNDFNKFTLSGNYRGLPWNSVLSARYTWSKTTSSADLATTALNSIVSPALNSTYPQEPKFNGENINQSFAFAWTARPMSNLDTRFYYYWTKLENNSDLVEYGNAPVAGQILPSGLGCGNIPPATGNPATTAWLVGNCENELYNYTKNQVGFDAWWRFAKGQRVGIGYEYQNLDQDRVDYSGATTNTFFAEYKNNMLETLTARLKYRYIKRDGDFNWSNEGVNANDANYLLRFVSAFDTQSSTTNEFKLNLDWTPMANLGLYFQGVWAKQNFEDVTYGRTDNDRQGYYLGGNWTASNGVMLSGWGSWEEVKYPSNHRYIGTVSGGPPATAAVPVPTPPGWCVTSGASANPNCYDPNQNAWFIPVGSTSYTGSYNWQSQTKDTTWMIGVGLDWPVAPNWMLKASYLYVENDGEATFNSYNNAGNPINIGSFDDTKQQYFNLKATYQYNKNWSFSAGYAYEKFSRNDTVSSNFTYVYPTPAISPATGNQTSYTNGYYLNPNNNQNIFYITASFTFDPPPLPAAK